MLIDALLSLVPIGGNLSLVAGAGVAIPSTNVIDLLGVGPGNAPPNIFGNATTFGEDPGIGRLRPEIACGIGQGLAGPGGTGLNFALQYAPDTGLGGGYQPGAWQTAVETGILPLALLGANAKIGRFPWLPAFPDGARVRFVRGLFTVSGGPLTAGTIAFCGVTMSRDDQSNRQSARNYSVA